MLTIDMASMLSAVSSLEEANGLPIATGYLNRQTGEIVFVHDNANEAGTRLQRVDGIDSELTRARLEAAKRSGWSSRKSGLAGLISGCRLNPGAFEYWHQSRARTQRTNAGALACVAFAGRSMFAVGRNSQTVTRLAAIHSSARRALTNLQGFFVHIAAPISLHVDLAHRTSPAEWVPGACRHLPASSVGASVIDHRSWGSGGVSGESRASSKVRA